MPPLLVTYVGCCGSVPVDETRNAVVGALLFHALALGDSRPGTRQKPGALWSRLFRYGVWTTARQLGKLCRQV